MIFRHVVYDIQFSFVTIYKVGKCTMPGVLKICSDFKSHVVYSRLKVYYLLSVTKYIIFYIRSHWLNNHLMYVWIHLILSKI